MAQAVAAGRHEHQQHPIKVYFIVWGWLFVLSTFSYLVDYFHLVGYLRWSLILLFMRSEEHTSELQSLMRISYAVFCLKKKIITIHILYAIRLTYNRQHRLNTTPQ